MQNLILRKIKLKTVFLLVILLILIAQSSSAIATPVSTKKSELSRLKNQVDSIDHQIELIDEEYLQAKIKLNKINAAIYTNSKSLDKAQKKLQSNKIILSKRVRAIYTQDEDSSFGFLLKTKSFDELITNWSYINRISENDAKIIKETIALKNKIEEAAKNLEINLKNQNQIVKKIAIKKETIKNEIARKKKLINGLESDLQAYAEAERKRTLRLAAIQAKQEAQIVEPAIMPTNAPKSNVVQIAMKYLGRPYSWGAAGPNSFDCSGLTMYVYAQIGIGLPHSSQAQSGIGQYVPRSALQPGDLIFRGNPVHHVGIYIGNGQMIHAPQTGDVIRVGSAFSGNYAGARRP